MTFLEQHHHADRHDRLCHGKNAEDRVLRRRRASGGTLLAKRIEPSDLAAAGDHDRRARYGSLVDLAPEGVGHALQRLNRKPDRFRLCMWQRRGMGGRRLPGGGLRSHLLFPCSFWFAGSLVRPSLAEKTAVEQGVRRFALAIAPLLYA